MTRQLLIGSILAVAGGAVAAQMAPSPTPTSADRVPHSQSMIDGLRSIVEADPANVNERIRLGLMLKELGRDREAARWLAEAARLDLELVDQQLQQHHGHAGAPTPISGGSYPSEGADVIVGDLPATQRFGREDGITAYSVATTSCNAGDEPLLWVSNTNQHPVIAQHMYRLKDGRFEMIGQSWVKHGFFALQGSNCTAQFGYSCQPHHNGTALGVGCSDPYSASLNGSYTYLGPKHEINPSTGYFPYPYGSYPNHAPIGKRLQVRDQYLAPTLNSGALYFVEGHYIAPDDAAAGNDLNNASYRRVEVTESSPNVFNLSFVSGHPTRRELAAIFAWQEFDPEVQIIATDVPDDGRFLLGYKVSDNGDGTWNYEFALHNFNSDRSGRSFSVPIPPGVNVSNIGYHDVEWHSGAPYSNDPWTATLADGMLTWTTESYDANVNANALRWGTLYNFRFDADSPPTGADLTLGLFKPGKPDSMTIAAVGPEPVTTPGDLNGDGVVDVSDLLILLGEWGACNDCNDCPADLTGDCVVDVSDLLILLGNWG